MTAFEAEREVILMVDAASGGTYTLYRLGAYRELSCEERLSRRGTRFAATLGGGLVVTALLIGANFAMAHLSSEIRYALFLVPCIHPALGFTVAFVAAHRLVRPGLRTSTLVLGKTCQLDGEAVGGLARVERDDATITLYFASGATLALDCHVPSEAVALAHELSPLGSRALRSAG